MGFNERTHGFQIVRLIGASSKATNCDLPWHLVQFFKPRAVNFKSAATFQNPPQKAQNMGGAILK